MSKICETCPINKGFDGERIFSCGDPTARCVDFRGRLTRQVESWNRLAQMAELSRGGVFDLLLLKSDDRIALLSANPNIPWNEEQERLFIFMVDSVADDGVVKGRVSTDSYNDLSAEDPRAGWAVPIGEEITIYGASSAGNAKREGVLVAGQQVDYHWRDRRWGMTLQDVIIAEGAGLAQSYMFGTDLSTYRSAPIA